MAQGDRHWQLCIKTIIVYFPIELLFFYINTRATFTNLNVYSPLYCNIAIFGQSTIQID